MTKVIVSMRHQALLPFERVELNAEPRKVSTILLTREALGLAEDAEVRATGFKFVIDPAIEDRVLVKGRVGQGPDRTCGQFVAAGLFKQLDMSTRLAVDGQARIELMFQALPDPKEEHWSTQGGVLLTRPKKLLLNAAILLIVSTVKK